MSRRDTVIIAVLINAGLLIVLFATALKSDDKKQQLAYEPSPAISTVSELPIRPEMPKITGDEVDQVLSQYSSSGMNQSPQAPIAASSPQINSSHVTSAVKEAPQQLSSFADDLKAITIPSDQVPAPSAVSSSFNPIEKKENGFVEVTVKKGDVLEKIARLNSTTVEEIMRINDLASTRLKIGQVLRIPGKSAKKADQASSIVVKNISTPSKTASAPKFYIVKNGDNPWTIAVKNHMKVDELLKLNQLDEEKARHLKPGDQLRIR